MTPCDDVTISTAGCEEGKCRIRLPGGAEVGPVWGQVLENAFTLPDGRLLLILTDDCPFEEGIRIFLFRPDGQIDDMIQGGVIYTPGLYFLKSVRPDGIDFTFFSDRVVHHLTIDPPRWRWRLGLPTGWTYGGPQLRRYLFLTESEVAGDENDNQG
ncbi:MAG: hypothetical protein AAFV19_13215 [Pseudomonadota bacterium]